MQGSSDRSRNDRWEQRLGLGAGALDRVIWLLPASLWANVGSATEDEVCQDVAHTALQDCVNATMVEDMIFSVEAIGMAGIRFVSTEQVISDIEQRLNL